MHFLPEKIWIFTLGPSCALLHVLEGIFEKVECGKLITATTGVTLDLAPQLQHQDASLALGIRRQFMSFCLKFSCISGHSSNLQFRKSTY